MKLGQFALLSFAVISTFCFGAEDKRLSNIKIMAGSSGYKFCIYAKDGKLLKASNICKEPAEKEDRIFVLSPTEYSHDYVNWAGSCTVISAKADKKECYSQFVGAIGTKDIFGAVDMVLSNAISVAFSPLTLEAGTYKAKFKISSLKDFIVKNNIDVLAANYLDTLSYAKELDLKASGNKNIVPVNIEYVDRSGLLSITMPKEPALGLKISQDNYQNGKYRSIVENGLSISFDKQKIVDVLNSEYEKDNAIYSVTNLLQTVCLKTKTNENAQICGTFDGADKIVDSDVKNGTKPTYIFNANSGNINIYKTINGSLNVHDSTIDAAIILNDDYANIDIKNKTSQTIVIKNINLFWKDKTAIKLNTPAQIKLGAYEQTTINAKVDLNQKQQNITIKNANEYTPIYYGYGIDYSFINDKNTKTAIGGVNLTLEDIFNKANIAIVQNRTSVAPKTYAINTQTKEITKKVAVQDDLMQKIQKAPQAKQDSSQWLLAIGIENYANVFPVSFSKASTDAFALAAKKSLGIPQSNSFVLTNERATTGAIKDSIAKLTESVNTNDTIVFYYSGHGIPDTKSGDAFILPYDKSVAYATNEENMRLASIYNELYKSKAKSVVIIVDSCFSGITDNESIYKGVAGSVIRTKKLTIPDDGKVVLITAGKDNQFSNSYEAKGHRLFSYFVINAMLDGRKNAQELYYDIWLKVKDESRKKGGVVYEQEPQIYGNGGLKL